MQGNIAMAKNSPSAVKEGEELDERLNTSIAQHLDFLEIVFKQYFPELEEQKATYVRNPFSTA